MLLKKYDTIVFAGDSITDAGKNRPYGLDGLGQGLGEGYVHFVYDLIAATYPELNINVVNSGIGGDTSSALCSRWQKDVLDFKSEWVSICIGVNDSIGKFLGTEHIEHEESYKIYRKNLEYMISSAQENGAKVIVISPYISEPWQDDPLRSDMDQFRKISEETAEKFSCKYIDLQTMFDAYFKIKHQCCIAWDRIHPNRIGAYMIAREFLKAVEFEF